MDEYDFDEWSVSSDDEINDDDWTASIDDLDTVYWQNYFSRPELPWDDIEMDSDDEIDLKFYPDERFSSSPKPKPTPTPAKRMVEKSPPILGHQFLLIDLDGTLLDTADRKFETYKKGITKPNYSIIKPFPDAQTFINLCRNKGYEVVIVSDSHPSYVKQVIQKFFGSLPFIFLADKPNPDKTLAFFQAESRQLTPQNAILIGDSWLDIEMGRALEIPTILTEFYQLSEQDPRDGLGNYHKNIRSGPTYFARNYNHTFRIIENRIEFLPPLEAYFYNQTLTHQSINLVHSKFKHDKNSDGDLTAFRALARQLRGKADLYDCSSKYQALLNPDTSECTSEEISIPVAAYIHHVMQKSSIHWDYLVHIPDKSYTLPAHKMENLTQAVLQRLANKGIHFQSRTIFAWKKGLSSTVRQEGSPESRKEFVNNNIFLTASDLAHKNIIILDDQFTTGATAQTIVDKLRNSLVGNILFIALWHYASGVPEPKFCPECQKKLQIKVSSKSGRKFLSCTPPEYQGTGCGYTEKIR